MFGWTSVASKISSFSGQSLFGIKPLVTLAIRTKYKLKTKKACAKRFNLTGGGRVFSHPTGHGGRKKFYPLGGNSKARVLVKSLLNNWHRTFGNKSTKQIDQH